MLLLMIGFRKQAISRCGRTVFELLVNDSSVLKGRREQNRDTCSQGKK
jgi:hypothetical protein